MSPRAAPALIAIDLDGTLLDSSHGVTEETIAALAHARARGIEVVLATSRGPRAVEPVLRTTALRSPAVFVASQGALTGRYGDHGLELLAQHPAPLDPSLRLVEAALAAGLVVQWFTGEDWLVSQVDHTVESEIGVVGVEPETADLLRQETGPDKLMLISPTEDVTMLQTLAQALPTGLRAQLSNPTYLEVTRCGVDKGAAVRAHCERRGVDAANVVAIGDGPNDLGLFAYAGLSIATANARSEVRAVADEVTASNDEEGVALALRRLAP